MWLAGMQRPDHNTLWRFYNAHRDGMRSLLRRTVRTAVKAGLVDLALQAVDGTRVAANASPSRTYDAERLKRLLDRIEAAISDLEAQNTTGGDQSVVSLPPELASAEELRRRVSEAIASVEEEEGPNYANLTDEDAGLLKTRRGGFITGYNAQSMVSPLSSDEDEGSRGLIITAVDVNSNSDDHPQLVSMIETAAHNTGRDPETVTLADAGYHSGPNLATCATHGYQVMMPDTHERRRRNPYHKDHFVYSPEPDTFLCPEGKVLSFKDRFKHENGYQLRRYQANGRDCRACAAFGECTPLQARSHHKSQRIRALAVKTQTTDGDRIDQENVSATKKQLWSRSLVSSKSVTVPDGFCCGDAKRCCPNGIYWQLRSISRAFTGCGAPRYN